MKILFDLIPLFLFFITAKVADTYKEWAAGFATQYFGAIVSGGVVSADDAPVLLSTAVVMIATLLQIIFLKARGKKIHVMLWTSAALIMVLGGLTIWLHSSVFVKWKPTAVYWFLGGALLGARLIAGKNLIHKLIGEELQEIQMPPVVWSRLNWAWVIFFGLMGALNLYVAFNYSFSTWVSFKAFGTTALMFVFVIGQTVFLARYMNPPGEEPAAKPAGDSSEGN